MKKNKKFYKVQASGNDFVLMLHQDFPISIDAMPAFAKKVCERHFGIGADGLIFLVPNPVFSDYSYSWHFYNSDGSRAEMCGNGARCATWLAVKLGLAQEKHAFNTDAGIIHATVNLEGKSVKILLCEPTNQKINLLCEVDNEKYTVHFVNTGVPHAVLVVDDVKAVFVNDLGSKIRYNSVFGKAGANVNFVQIIDDENLLIRTYERGLEKESFACGTGAAASAIITHSLGLTKNEVNVKTIKDELLYVQIRNNFVFLEGMAQLVYEGEYVLGA